MVVTIEEMLERLADKDANGWVALDNDMADAIRAELAKLQPKSMETAPKDGTPILANLRFKDGYDYGKMTIRWHEPWGQWVMSGCLIGIANCNNEDDHLVPFEWWEIEPPADKDGGGDE